MYCMTASRDRSTIWHDLVEQGQDRYSEPCESYSLAGRPTKYSPWLGFDLPKPIDRVPLTRLPEEIVPAVIIAQIEEERQNRLRRDMGLRIEAPDIRQFPDNEPSSSNR